MTISSPFKGSWTWEKFYIFILRVSDSPESKLNLLHILVMDVRSNWGNQRRLKDQFNNEELCDCEAPDTRKALPYQSLLSQLHALEMKHEMYLTSNWHKRSGFRLTSHTRHQIWTLKRELRFQQMIFMFLQNHGVMSETLNNVQAMAETVAESLKIAAAGPNANQFWQLRCNFLYEWESSVSIFLETIDQKIKPNLKQFCLQIVDQLVQGNFYSEYDISDFIDIIFLKLKDLEISIPNLIIPLRKQMKTLKETLNIILIIAWDENLRNFMVYFRPWVNIAATLVILDLVHEKDEELFGVVSPLLEKFNLSVLKHAEAYILVIKALKPSNVSEILIMREIVGCFINMLLENLIVSTDDHFEMLREWLTFWIALLMDPPQADAEDEKIICAQINILVDKAESLILSLCMDKLEEDTDERRNILLNDFLEKMNQAKAEIRQLHFEIPGLSWNNVPQMNGMGFFDLLLGNLQKKLESKADMFPFEKHLIAIVHKELWLLRPFLMDIFELQDEHKELKAIWVQASNMAYLVDYVTDSCLSFIDVPIWSNLMHLSNAVEQIQFVKTEVSKIRKNHQMYNNRVISAKLNSKVVLPGLGQANATTKDDVKVGFTREEQRIIDQLIAGKVGLDIVAIVGMPGQGKTNLAQRVFEDSCIKRHFNKCSWCCISQAYDIKRILKDILENVGEDVSQQFHKLTQDDLADWLRKCLKGQRYLVFLDDIWDAKALYELQLSFPHDNNGSRILLTSRNHNVALEVKADCCIVKLHPLSYEESWNLLRVKVFEEDACPPSLSDIGKTIAENCKGLPLAIVVVAGLLKKDKNGDSWKQTSKSLKSEIVSAGCMNLLDLSYNHLPDYLKPCFLYLGAFQEDKIIDVKRLIQFWIVEGFIQNDGMKSKEVIANEYLMDLVSRSLVCVAKRSSRFGIKKCRVHDLLREFCLIKAEEERFLLVPNESDCPSSLRCNHYGLRLPGKWGFFLDPKPIVPSLRSFLVSGSSFCGHIFAPSFFKMFKCLLLRVLDLNRVYLSSTNFDEITQLIHLRFLSVACEFPIPSSIVNLFRLEVLRLTDSRIQVILPSVVMKMANLRYIFAGQCRIEYTEDFDEVKLNLCPPLTNLETFTTLNFEVDEEPSFKRIAQKLPNILKLGLRLYFCVRLSIYFKKLESLNLSLFPRTYCYHWETEAISPSTVDFPLTLKKLNLFIHDKISRAMISSIGKLSNLEVLKLQVNFEDERWDVEDDEFLKLKYLEFRFSSIQEWNVSDESFPCLEQLVVKNCYKLGEIPCRFGAICTLKRIEVHNCHNIVTNSFQQIVDDQKDSGNEGLQFSISCSGREGDTFFFDGAKLQKEKSYVMPCERASTRFVARSNAFRRSHM